MQNRQKGLGADTDSSPDPLVDIICNIFDGMITARDVPAFRIFLDRAGYMIVAKDREFALKS